MAAAALVAAAARWLQPQPILDNYTRVQEEHACYRKLNTATLESTPFALYQGLPFNAILRNRNKIRFMVVRMT